MIFSLVVLGLLLQAAPPVATVTAGEPFLLKGVQVPVAGTPKWPVMSGDEVAALQAPVQLTFKDGSKVTLGQRSRVRVEQEGEQPAVRLLEGVSQYALTAGTSLRLFAGSRSVTPTGLVGSVRMTAAAETGTAAPERRVMDTAPTAPPPVSRRR
jgi:ferric-dicitrate binding protein FerR (iron transport regulator)